MIRGTNVELTPKLLDDIDNWGEKVYARDCLGRKGIGVVCQVPIGNSIIDFKVTDLKTGRSKLVEVTSSPKGKNGRTNGRRKRKQKKRWKGAGCPTRFFMVKTLLGLAIALREMEVKLLSQNMSLICQTLRYVYCFDHKIV